MGGTFYPLGCRPKHPGQVFGGVCMSRGVVLLVEDEPLVNLTLQANLEDAGWTVISACCGIDAIDYLEDSIGALTALVTDIRLGAGLSGWKVAQAARARRAELPIVYITADSAYMAELAVPGSRVLQKPGVIHELIPAIDQLVN